MLRKSQQNAQAATELAVFGAILIFLLSSIIRTAVSAGYAQNQHFKAMRLAMLASWRGSQAGNTSHNNASVVFVEDRLSPDANKYGDLDRNPAIAFGSGTFSYQMLYPVDVGEVNLNLPIMDLYVNGQHFPLTTASYVENKVITRNTGVCNEANACLQEQCLRNQREWVGGTVNVGLFKNIVPVSLNTTPAPGSSLAQTIDALMQANAMAIFSELKTLGLISNIIVSSTDGSLTPDAYGFVSVLSTTEFARLMGSVSDPKAAVTTFSGWFRKQFASTAVGEQSEQDLSQELLQIQQMLQNNKIKYKLFYKRVPNPGDTQGSSNFSPSPPQCNAHPCKDAELSADLVLGSTSNTGGDLMYDLRRTGASNALIEQEFGPPVSSCPAQSQRCFISWQWAATAGTVAGDTKGGADPIIGLKPDDANYPSYDIDGRLKEVVIYKARKNASGDLVLDYEDFQGGDIDATHDSNSCDIQAPGLLANSQIFTFTKNGTYLQVKEGQLYNPESGLWVRSMNRKDTIDLVQRKIYLTNDTGRFCQGSTPLPCVGGAKSCLNDPNPVEVCIPKGSTDNCFSSDTNIKSTCYDANGQTIFVRSRLHDRQGGFWMTNVLGQLKV